MDLGEQKVILGYPWFAAMQPKVDWARAWIDFEQLPVVLRTLNAHKVVFTQAKDKWLKVKASFKNLTKKLQKTQSEDQNVHNASIRGTTNHICKPPTNTSIQTGQTGTEYQESHTTPRTLSKTCPCIQQTRCTKIPQTTTMGPCNRTQERRPSHPTRKDLHPHTR